MNATGYTLILSARARLKDALNGADQGEREVIAIILDKLQTIGRPVTSGPARMKERVTWTACPECGGRLSKTGGCTVCEACGYVGSCG